MCVPYEYMSSLKALVFLPLMSQCNPHQSQDNPLTLHPTPLISTYQPSNPNLPLLYTCKHRYPDLGGNTALHHAAQNGHRKSVQLLLETAADAMVRNTGGQTAYVIPVPYGVIICIYMVLLC